MLLDGLTGATALDADTKSGASQAKLSEELNRFLVLLVTQLQNQDPLDPLDASEFTSQLVQFASVEQQIYSNAHLEKLLKLQQTSQIATMIDFIGNTVEAIGNELPLEDGKAEYTYTLDGNAVEVTITIQDSSGLTVYTADGETEIGKHTLQWDGRTNNGIQKLDAAYTVLVSALDHEGGLVDVSQTVYGRVSGAGAEDGLVSLFLGQVVIPMDNVVSIKESAPVADPVS